jgi:hypothetical protein
VLEARNEVVELTLWDGDAERGDRDGGVRHG